jgi:thiamine-phosphate pyrophosphorylase
MTAPRRSAADKGRSAPRLYLVTPPLDTPALEMKLAEALAAADVAAVLARAPADRGAGLIERVRAIAPAVQDRGVAFLIEGHPESVEPAGADGAHVTGIAAFDAALPALKPRYIVGCGGLGSRHDAMVAGERGADYVMFGEPDSDGRRPAFAAVLDRVAWWAELFEIPCVGWAMNLDEVAALAGAGADFVAVADAVWTDPHGPGAAVANAVARLKTSERVP